jgi:hypothetical protein
MNGLHEVVRHIMGAQRGMGYERSGLSHRLSKDIHGKKRSGQVDAIDPLH